MATRKPASPTLPLAPKELDEPRRDAARPMDFEMEIRDIRTETGVVLRRKEPMVLRASLDDSDGCYRADIPGLEIPISVFDRAEMKDALNDMLLHLWEEYAREDDVNLTPRARRMKAHLLHNYAETG